jgi:hypothetical protein
MQMYSLEKTVLMCTKESQVSKTIAAKAKNLNYKIYYLEKPEDILAVPCFVFVLDAESIIEPMVELMEIQARDSLINEWRIVLLSENKEALPESLWERTLNLDSSFNVNEIFLQKETPKKAKRIDSVYRRVDRIVKIYLELSRNNKLSPSEACNRFKIHPRTFNRDIKLLRDLGLPVYYHYEGAYYYL